MKYILMMNCPKYGYDSFGSWPKKDIQAHIAFMIAFDKPLKASGELLSAEGLANPHEAKLVRGGIGGAGARRRPVEHGDRSAAGDERAA